MKILAINDTASVMSTIMKHINELDMIYNIRNHRSEFRKVLTLNDRVQQIKVKNYLELTNILRKMRKKYDLFHCTGWSAISAYLAGVKYGVHFHGTDIREWGRNRVLKRRARRFLDQIVLENAQYVVVSTPDLLNYTKLVRPDAKWIPNPIDLEVFTRNGVKKGFREPTLLLPARMDNLKGHEIVWEALKICPNKPKVIQPDWGVEPDWSNFKRTAPKNVEFIPLIPREEISTWYRGATCVLGQFKLGFYGMSEIEAVACGTPVLTWDKYTDNFFLKTNNPTELADMIGKIISTEDFRSEVISKEYKYVIDTHDSIKISKKWRNLWNLDSTA